MKPYIARATENKIPLWFVRGPAGSEVRPSCRPKRMHLEGANGANCVAAAVTGMRPSPPLDAQQSAWRRVANRVAGRIAAKGIGAVSSLATLPSARWLVVRVTRASPAPQRISTVPMT